MSRTRARAVPLFVVLALGFAAYAASLEHFAVYEVQGVSVGFGVLLRDQLGPAKQAKVLRLTHFANPTRKVHGQVSVGVNQPNHHLSWYAIRQVQLEPRRTVRFKNQFGQHSVDIQTPRFLLVPAQKTSHAGSSFPRGLDHYKCYKVIRVNTAPPLPVIKMGDQFGSQQNVRVGRPVLFCPPVRKARPGAVSQPIFNRVDHLAVYPVTPQPRSLPIKIRDQFGQRQLNVVRKVLLAVPTQKQAVVAHP
ncbi:MAG: DUF7450 family protein [Gemmatimonadales bacterium]